MYIEKVEIENFRGYRNKRVFHFDNCPFVLLSAQNGVGKTSLLDAIEWCLTGAIGRFRNRPVGQGYALGIDKRGGQLKNKFASDKDLVTVEVVIVDGSSKHVVHRSSRNDKLGIWSRDDDLLVDGIPHCEDDWLDQNIGSDFYNYHVCDVHKTIGFQTSDRSEYWRLIKDYISDYSKEETLVQNLLLLSRDIERRIENLKGKLEQIEISLKEKTAETADVLDDEEVLKYPEVKAYPDEVFDFSDVGMDDIVSQKEIIRKIGYAYIVQLQSELDSSEIAASKLRKLKQLRTLVGIVHDKIAESFEDLYDSNSYKSRQLQNRINNFNTVEITRDNVLVEADALLKIQMNELKVERKNILEPLIEELKETIENINSLELEISQLMKEKQDKTEGNRILQSFSDLISCKPDWLKYRNEARGEGDVRCPVCGSSQFGDICSSALMNQAEDYIHKSELRVNSIICELEGCNTKIHDCFKKCIESVIKIRIVINRFDNEDLGHLSQISKSAEAFDKLAGDLNEYYGCQNDIVDFNDVEYLNSLIRAAENDLLDDDEVDSKRKDICELMIALGYTVDRSDDTDPLRTIMAQELTEGVESIGTIRKTDIIQKLVVLTQIIANRKLGELKEEIRILEKSKDDLERRIASLQKIKDNVEIHRRYVDSLIRELRQREYKSVGPNLLWIYRKLARVPSINEIQIVQERDKPLIRDELDKPIANVLSNGQISVFMLAFFFSQILSRKTKERFKVYFIDDITACLDDVNMLAFLDLMKYQMEKRNSIEQLFFSTCDERLQNLLRYKLNGADIRTFEVPNEAFIEQNV